MIMKLSVSDGFCSVRGKEEFAFLKECGFDAVDFQLGAYLGRGGVFSDIDKVTDEELKEYFTNLRLEAEKVGFEIGQTHSQFDGHLRSYDNDIDEIVKREIASIKATHYLGSKHCVIHPLILVSRRYDRNEKESLDMTEEFYRRLIPTLEEYDVYACLENMWNYDAVYGNICATIFSHCDEMVRMCETLGDRFKICVDIGHGLLTQDDPIEMVKIAGDKLACIHAHDNDGVSDLHTFPWSVKETPYNTNWKPLTIDWIELMKAFDEINYRGNLNFEMNIPGPAPIKKAGAKYLAEIERYLISLRTVKY